MHRLQLILIPLILLLSAAANAGTTVENVRVWSENDKTRVVLDLSRSVDHNIFTLRSPDRLVIDLKDSRLADVPARAYRRGRALFDRYAARHGPMASCESFWI